MKKLFVNLLFFSLLTLGATAQVVIPHSQSEDKDHAMSDKYWDIWNPEVQSQIDADIDQYRKSDAEIKISGLKKGTDVKIEQLSSDFFFGAHIFNFNQLGKKEYNDRYKELYGTLFNSATIAFYWRPFESQKGRIRFREEWWDTEDWWANCEDPKSQPHWRRPASDPVVAFCKSKGIRLHGHPLIWGDTKWYRPNWLEDLVPEEEKEALKRYVWYQSSAGTVTSDTLDKYMPKYGELLEQAYAKRIEIIADYYKGTIDSWDVVNESAIEWKQNRLGNNKLMVSRYVIMPDDYPYKSFQVAQKVFPENVKLNINDYLNEPAYVELVKNLQSRGCKIDIAGSQMHLFDPKQSIAISEGADIMTPKILTDRFELLSQMNVPIHLSEITITAPSLDEKGEMVQAIIARNLYRKWFSVKDMMGITWWNVVDDCGAPGEPSFSGLFHRDMTPKPSYYALKELILNEFRTNITVKADSDSVVKFRGFKGNYRITWKDKKGEHTQEYHLQ